MSQPAPAEARRKHQSQLPCLGSELGGSFARERQQRARRFRNREEVNRGEGEGRVFREAAGISHRYCSSRGPAIQQNRTACGQLQPSVQSRQRTKLPLRCPGPSNTEDKNRTKNTLSRFHAAKQISASTRHSAIYTMAVGRQRLAVNHGNWWRWPLADGANGYRNRQELDIN